MIDVNTLQTVVFGIFAITGTVMVLSIGVFAAVGVRTSRTLLLPDRSDEQDDYERERRRREQMSRAAADRAQSAGPAPRSDESSDDDHLVEWTSDAWAISVRETQPERFLLEVVDTATGAIEERRLFGDQRAALTEHKSTVSYYQNHV